MIKAELLAARGTRSVWALAALTVALCVAWAVLEVLVFMRDGGDTVDSAYSMAGQGYLLAMVLGIMLAAGEYRHRTITWRLLVTPQRGRVIAAKLAACGIIGLLVGIAAAVVTPLVTAGLLAGTGHTVVDAGVAAVLVGSVLGTALWTMLGAALGILIRHQAAAITVAFVWFYYAEWALVALVPAVGRWTPTGAAKALSGWNRVGLPVPGALLSAWAGGLLLLAYAVAAAYAANLTTARRDVT
jgi:ABC-type transport system involved in multi-copper enzyme maturation permease subunit